MDQNGLHLNDAVSNAASLECRTCLHTMSPTAVLFNIFEMWSPPWDGMANTIAEDLEKLANVKAVQPGKHSYVICRACYELLHSACTFVAMVQQNDQILQERFLVKQETDRLWPKPIQLDKPINSCMYQSSMNVEIKQEVLSDNEYDAANGVYDNEEDFDKMDIKVEPEELIQPQPSKHFTINGNSLDTFEDDMMLNVLTNGNSAQHFLTNIKEEPLSDEETEPIQPDLPLECLLCAKDFKSVTKLKAHVLAQHSYKLVKRKDSDCVSAERSKCFETPTDLIEHETNSVCLGCNESFDSFKLLTKHRQTCKALVKVSQEDKKLNSLDDVLRLQPQEQKNTLKCVHCHETFTDNYYLNIHREIHHSSPSVTTDFPKESEMEVEALDNIFSDHSNSFTEDV